MDILDEFNPYKTFLGQNLWKIYPIKHFCFYGTSIKNIMNVHLVKMQIFEREKAFGKMSLVIDRLQNIKMYKM